MLFKVRKKPPKGLVVSFCSLGKGVVQNRLESLKIVFSDDTSVFCCKNDRQLTDVSLSMYQKNTQNECF